MMDIPAPGARLKDIKAILITKNNRESTAPAWSPDGSKIAYCSTSNGVRQFGSMILTKGRKGRLHKEAAIKKIQLGRQIAYILFSILQEVKAMNSI